MSLSGSRVAIAVRTSLCVMALLMAGVVADFSMSGDEVSQMRIGRDTYKYLGRTFGWLPGSVADIPVSGYSGLFGVITTFLVQHIGGDEILIRHSLIALTGWATILYAGKCARRLRGRWAELLTIWLLFCSPRFFGASMNNSKDIPFALGMTMAAYFLLLLVQAAPTLHRKHLWGFFAGLFIAFAVRIGGVFFVFYALTAWAYLLMHFRKTHPVFLQKLTAGMLLSGVGAFVLSLLFVPGLWANPLLLSAKAVHRFSNYSIAMTMLYRGQDIETIAPPWHYLPVWVGITIPVVVLFLFLIGVLQLFRKPRFPEILLLAMVLLPVLFLIINRSAVYDSWRHYYFIYPPLVVLAGNAGTSLYARLQRPVLRFGFLALGAAGLFLPIAWSVRNHPLEHLYFNELVGGIRGAYDRYETDYYGDGLLVAHKKLLRHLPKSGTGDSLTVAENVAKQFPYYLQRSRPDVRVRHVFYSHRDTFNWQYGVFATRGIDTFWKRPDWPPAGMIDSVTADGVLLIAIIRRLP